MMAQTYHLLPSEVLNCTPGEFYLNWLLTADPTIHAPEDMPPPRPARRERDPSLTALFDSLHTERNGG